MAGQFGSLLSKNSWQMSGAPVILHPNPNPVCSPEEVSSLFRTCNYCPYLRSESLSVGLIPLFIMNHD